MHLGKLEPDAIRSSLVRAGLFLAGWELLVGEIVDKVKDFYLMGFDATGELYEGYEEKVLKLHRKSTLRASLIWLVKREALTLWQMERVYVLKDHRNDLAHELPKILLDPGHEVSTDLFKEVLDMISVLGRFWGGIEVDINPDFDGADVNRDEIVSGTMLLMGYIVQAAEDRPTDQDQ